MTLPIPLPQSSPLPIRKRLERSAGRAAMRILLPPLRALPLPISRRIGRAFGGTVYHLLGRYRRVALKNLALIYGEKSDRDRAAMARAVFRHFGEMAAEFIKLPKLSREQVDEMTTVEGEEHLIAALQSGRGCFIVTGHLGNWEFLGRWLATHNYKLNVVARDARDPAATKLMTEVRQGTGSQVLYRGSSARGVLQSLKRNELVALLPDQNAADVFVPFMGITTGTVDGPAILHLKTGAPLVFSWCCRTAGDRFRIVFESPEVISPTGNRDGDIRSIMTLINARLEAQILQNPTQWLWLHDRWKASPGVFADGAYHAHELRTPTPKFKREIEELNDSARR